MTAQQYVDQMKINKHPFMEIYTAVKTPDKIRSFFRELTEPIRLAVFTAEWCGDAISTTSTILRLAEEVEGLTIRVFDWDHEVKLANSFLPIKRANTVPVFVALDNSMSEIARFIETASGLVSAIDAMDLLVGQVIPSDAEEIPAIYAGQRTGFRVSHSQDWGEVILDEFSRVISDGLSLPPEERPAVGGTKWPPQG